MRVSAAAERRRGVRHDGMPGGKYELPYRMGKQGLRRVDGYTPPVAEVTTAQGVYVIALFNGNIFLFPNHGENEGKLEAVGAGVLTKIPLGAYEVISGGVHSNEEACEAAQRETTEERRIAPTREQFSNSLPPLQVTQRRSGSLVQFDVAGYTLQLTEDQATVLRQEGALEFSPEELKGILSLATLELRSVAQAALLAYLAREQV